MPIVFGIAKTMHRRGEYVVKSVEITRCHRARPGQKTRVLFPIYAMPWGPWFAGTHAGVDLAIEAATYGVPPAAQVQGRANRRHGLHMTRCV